MTKAVNYKVARAQLEKFISGEETPTEDDIILMAKEILNRRDHMREKLSARPRLGFVLHEGVENHWTVNDETKNFTINVADRWVGYVTSGNIKSTQRWSWGLRDDSTGVIVGSGVCDSATAGRKLVEGLLRGAFLRR